MDNSVAASVDTSTTPFEDAAEGCGIAGRVEGGASISFETNARSDLPDDDLTDMVCFLRALDIPDDLRLSIGNTRLIDGPVQASWERYGAFWRYDRDSGLSLTVRLRD